MYDTSKPGHKTPCAIVPILFLFQGNIGSYMLRLQCLKLQEIWIPEWLLGGELPSSTQLNMSEKLAFIMLYHWDFKNALFPPLKLIALTSPVEVWNEEAT